MNSRKRKYVWLLHVMAILPPIFLLTLRAEGCGTDTVHYVEMYDILDVSNWVAFIAETRLEPLFAVLMYGMKSLNLSIEYLFFACGLLTIAPVYLGSVKLKEKADPLIIMSLFYLMFYQYSFNIVRQSIAMSLIFLATIYLIENRSKISFLLGVIALMFHTVSLVFFFAYFAFILIDKDIKYLTLFAIISSLVVVYINPTFFTYNFERFQSYQEKGEAGMQMSYLIEMIINFFVVLYVWKRDHGNLRRLFLFVSGFTLFLILMSTRGPFIFRIANCLDILVLIYVPLAMKNIHQKSFTVSYMSFALFFWWFVFIYNGSGRSYPYILSPTFNLF